MTDSIDIQRPSLVEATARSTDVYLAESAEEIARLLPNAVKQRENHSIPPNMIQYDQPNRIRRDASVSC